MKGAGPPLLNSRKGNTVAGFHFLLSPPSLLAVPASVLSYPPPGKDAYGAKLNFSDLQIEASGMEGIRVDTCSGSVEGERSSWQEFGSEPCEKSAVLFRSTVQCTPAYVFSSIHEQLPELSPPLIL